MKWLNWFRGRPDEEGRYQAFKARFLCEQEQKRRMEDDAEEKEHRAALLEAYGEHGQG